MKYILTLTLLVLLASCNKTRCYEFTYINTITVSPAIEGYPKKSISTNDVCDLSKSEAEQLGKFRFDTTYTAGKYTFTESKVTEYKKTRYNSNK